jgi:diguanylate cyclase (GGDEF)-like protein
VTLRVLLAESDTEEVLFLRDVLEDMESSEFWSAWLHLDVFDAPSWSFAESVLQQETIDVILMDLNLPDASGAGVFRNAQSAAPHIPIVLLVDEADVDLAGRLIREGAQDFLIKKNIDCEPLAHALRNAVERQRLLCAARAAAMTDPLTGLLNRAAFQVLAERDRRLAESGGRRLGLLIAEPSDLIAAQEGQQRDLVLVEAADHLRSLAGPTDLVARIGEDRFAVVVWETDVEPLERACSRFQSSFGSTPLRIGTAVLNPYQPVSLDMLQELAETSLGIPAAAARA